MVQKCFYVDCTTPQSYVLGDVSRNITRQYLSFFRKLVLVAAWQECEKYKIGNGVEVDESYVGQA